MKEVNTIEEVYAVMAKVKHGASEYITNFYPNDDRLGYWIKNGILFLEDHIETAFFFWRDREFFHLFYCSKSPADLKSHLMSLYTTCSEVLIADIPGRGSDVLQPVSLFEEAGFRKYVEYVRIYKFIDQDEKLPPVSPDVIFPDPDDAAIITEMFEANFDIFAEQVPCFDEIRMAIKDNKITVIKDEGRIVGILMRDIADYTATGRFFLVNPNIRGKGIGSKLMNYFLTECKGKRINAWVLAVNINSLQIYDHYNFKIDTFRDQLMINRNNILYERKS